MNYWAPVLDKINETELEHEKTNAIITKQPQSEAKQKMDTTNVEMIRATVSNQFRSNITLLK
jgi:hypothetical protein